jgi:SAM-dependent methyltransferase
MTAAIMTKAEKQHIFWERMVESYPAPFDAEHLLRVQEIIALAEQQGIVPEGKVILDIGCGTGVYSLPLAQRAVKVVGLDFSEGMIRRFEEECRQHGIANARSIHSPWTDAAVEAHGLEKAFDLVWAAMTPAIRTKEDVERMNRCSRHSCVAIAWGGKRINTLMEEVFQAHDLAFGPPPGAKAVQAGLAELGIQAEILPIDSHWDWEGSEEEALLHVEGFLMSQAEDVEPKVDQIKEILARYTEDGRVQHRTEVEMGMLVWYVS